MLIEIDLSNQAVEKIKALGALTGKSPREISGIISGMVESSLADVGNVVEIALTGAPVEHHRPVHRPTMAIRKEPEPDFRDTTGISDGLGGEDNFIDDLVEDIVGVDAEEIAGETNPEALVASAVNLSDEEVEAAVPQDEEGGAGAVPAAEPTFSDDLIDAQTVEAPAAEQVFGDMLGVKVPDAAMGDAMPTDHPRSKAQRKARALKKPRKGRAVPLTGEPT